ncbi:MAG: hypothetical protein AAFS04_02250 [Cyanobacteria bacterium J06631_9]
MKNAYLTRAALEITADYGESIKAARRFRTQNHAQLNAVLERIHQQAKLPPFPDLKQFEGDVNELLQAITQWQISVDIECKRMEEVAEVNLQGWKNADHFTNPLHTVGSDFGLKGMKERFSTSNRTLKRLIRKLGRIRDFKESYELEVSLLGAEAAALYQYEKLAQSIDNIDFPEFPSSIGIDDGVSVYVNNAEEFPS